MEQRDILKDQIEQAGKVLGKMIEEYFNLKSNGNINEAILATNHQLRSQLDIDVEMLVSLEDNDLVNFISARNFTDIDLDNLSNYFYEIGLIKKQEKKTDVKTWFATAKQLLDIAADLSQTITFERMGLKLKIENEINNNIYYT